MEKMILIPEGDFIERVGEALFKRFQSAGLVSALKTQSNKWLTHSEAATYVRKSKAALYKLTSIRKIRYTKRGKSNMYRVEDLDFYMSAGFQETADEVVRELKLLPKRKYSLTKK
jgi:hypothetical protein